MCILNSFSQLSVLLIDNNCTSRWSGLWYLGKFLHCMCVWTFRILILFIIWNDLHILCDKNIQNPLSSYFEVYNIELLTVWPSSVIEHTPLVWLSLCTC
jgi:hypothetical protein